MTGAAVAAQVHQTLDVHGDFATQIAFHRELGHAFTQLVHVRVRQILHLCGGIDPGFHADLMRARTANAIDRRERDYGMLMVRDVYPSNPGHVLTPSNKNEKLY
jgi:hypothetical protein